MRLVPNNMSTKTGSGAKYTYIRTRRGINGQIHVSTVRSAKGSVVVIAPLAREDSPNSRALLGSGGLARS